jgi:hypothetical protein
MGKFTLKYLLVEDIFLWNPMEEKTHPAIKSGSGLRTIPREDVFPITCRAFSIATLLEGTWGMKQGLPLTSDESGKNRMNAPCKKSCNRRSHSYQHRFISLKNTHISSVRSNKLT